MKHIPNMIMLGAVTLILSFSLNFNQVEEVQKLTPYEETMNDFTVHSIELSTQYN